MYYIHLQCATGKKAHVQKIHEDQVLNYLDALNLLAPASLSINSQSRRPLEVVNEDLDLEYSYTVHGFIVPGEVINRIQYAIRKQDHAGHIHH